MLGSCYWHNMHHKAMLSNYLKSLKNVYHVYIVEHVRQATHEKYWPIKGSRGAAMGYRDDRYAITTVDNRELARLVGTQVAVRPSTSSAIAIAHEPVWGTFDLRLPRRPHATDDFEQGAFRRPLEEALTKRYVEYNPFGRVSWLIFDIDRDDAFEAWEDACLPAPNIFIQNRGNGRGHLAYALTSPVGTIGDSRPEPIRFAADVQRGMTLRLRADPHYTNRFAKNPLHPDWRASSLAIKPYDLSGLRGWLDDSDVWRRTGVEHAVGLGRNCELFDSVRHYAYRKVGEFRALGHFGPWLEHVRIIAVQHNQGFATPLSISEVRGVAKSVAKWTWTKFGGPGFSEIQAERGRRGAEKRWEGHEALDYLRPWEAHGISRATYFRRQREAKEAHARDEGSVVNNDGE